MASTINDDRLTAVNDERKNTLEETQELYDTMAEESDQYYQAQIDASKEWEASQKANQQARTDFAIEQINQQKKQAETDYMREQSGAYADWQKESNRYGANAEELAASGMINTGYGESSQVRMYNTYQNRVATARQTFELAKQNYENAITEARLQNSSVLAEIAYNAYQQQLELSLQGFQYKNDLLLEGANKQLEINKMYDNKYLSVLEQINTERELELKQAQAEENPGGSFDFTDGDETTPDAPFDPNSVEYIFNGGKTVTNPYISPFSNADRQAMVAEALAQVSKTEQPKQIDTHQKKLENAEKRMHSGESKVSASQQKKLAKTEKNPQTKAGTNATVATEYYEGPLNPDARHFGVMANGYQPKGINGHGMLTKTGEKETIFTEKKYGGYAGRTVKLVQNVWRAEDGTTWIWDGEKNKYISRD